MKKIQLILVTGLAILATVTSCKKLELYPADQIERTQSFQSMKDAKTWNNGLYSQFRGRVTGSNVFITDIQADQLNASLDYGNRNGFPHRWGASFLSDDGTISGVWSGSYGAIANINTAIKGFEAITPATPAETTELNRYKGDNYLARAYYYFNLVLRYAKPYEPATAANDPAVPIVTEFDLEAKPARATVKQVYDQVLADIALAKANLSGVAGTQGAERFTIDAAVALEARVKLHMQDWAGAYTAANSLIAGGKYPLITDQTAFKNYWHLDTKTETIMQTFVKAPNELPAVIGSIYLGFNAGNNRFTPDWIPTQTTLDMYAANDIRKPVYFEGKAVLIQGVQYPGLVLINKYPGNPAYFTSAATNYEHNQKVFRIAEMYLIAAEASYRGGGGSALVPLNALRVARGLAPVASTGAALLQDIRDERFRELAFEGFRLDDLKRWHLGFTRGTPQNLAPIQKTPASDFHLMTQPADSEKIVWAIPNRERIINTNLSQNPGW